MGYFQNPIGEDYIPEKKYVDIQGPFPPAALLSPVPAEGGLDFLGTGQKLAGAVPVKTRHGGIEETALIGDMNRVRFIKRSAAEILQDLRQGFAGGFQNFPAFQAAEGPV
jgi:hypothetical protein